MQIAWIIGIVVLIVLLFCFKQYKKDVKPKEEPAETIKVNNKGCSIAFYIFFAVLIGVFVYYYILYRQSLG
ncbi:MAG: hypothetical protein IJ269_06285 [Bacteroidales bacterium]|nr:hypothetical protein [Bacteroidales bacterium]MBR7167213.1 hypothetical protein [Bacteroidales bacterium]